MVIGKITKLMVRESILIPMGQNMKDSGKKTNNMEKDSKQGQAVLVI